MLFRIASVFALGLVLGVWRTGNAQAQGVAATGDCPYWIDAATGERPRTVPLGVSREKLTNLQSDPTATQAHGASGRNYVKQPDGSWIDTATGQPARTVPIGVSREELTNLQSDPSANHAHGASGRNYVLVPCPPPQTAASTGLYLGGELAKNWGWVRSTERLAATDVVTNQFSDHADPVGGGLIVGYKFAPWANNIVVSPFVSFDFLNAPVNHTFPGGSFLGTTANFMGTFGLKAGPQLDMGLWLYGIAGLSVLNETLNINFIPVSSAQSAWAAGATLGLGAAFQPGFLQGFGHPVSLFVEYQHTWWQNANFNMPAASPFYNYTFARQDDMLKLGFTVDLGPLSP